MANWLQKFSAKTQVPKNLPVPQRSNPLVVSAAPVHQPATLPPATIVYAIAAAALIAVAVLFFISGVWLTGALVMLPAACFMGFAIHFLKNN